jgi:hypothetical protein
MGAYGQLHMCLKTITDWLLNVWVQD